MMLILQAGFSLSPGAGTQEELNSFLCVISDSSNDFFEETRKNYVDLQMRVEGRVRKISDKVENKNISNLEVNTNTLDEYGEQVIELTSGQAEINEELDQLFDSVDCGATGNNSKPPHNIICTMRIHCYAMLCI